MDNYVKLKDVLHILDVVITDENIKHTGKAIRKRLKELPPADVEKVVRCKECTEWDEIEGECSHWYGMRENCFCSYGKRKEGAEKC